MCVLYFLQKKNRAENETPAVRQPAAAQQPILRMLYSRKNVKIGWKNTPPNMIVPGRGFINGGSKICFMNSIIQALFHIPAFVNWIFEEKQHGPKLHDHKTYKRTNVGDTYTVDESRCTSIDPCIICIVCQTFDESQSSDHQNKAYKIDNSLIKNIGLKKYRQGAIEDAHEYYQCLIAAMQQSYLERIKVRLLV